MKAGPERELVERYLSRAGAGGKSLGLSGFTVAEFPESRASRPAQRKSEEATVLAGAIPEGAVIVALDERGQNIASLALADRVGRWRDEGRPALVFLIGGADGLDPALVARSDLSLAFSALTWPHQLVRIMLAEQIYRTTTILSGHPYHRGA
jgi:23S rRNA (pseudouridine1915-N3)-methyltransferase